ncbi:SCW11 (YGL028C) [Zygosaccharomyces parabailii]|nr:SCW11 (YGL028C) [Zygosaccharomyces parabailii]CDH09298.1 related to family 17 glucosidase SCW11 [Zygosaccharomyces bailii ISA1307]
MIDTIQLLAGLALVHSFAAALPVKREIITRMHTAPTHTNYDVYSTTTRIHVAPTVEFIIDGQNTYTTTLIPSNVDPDAEPATSTLYGTAEPSSSQVPAAPSSSEAAISNQWSSSAAPTQAATSSQWSASAITTQTPVSSSQQWSSSTWGSSSALPTTTSYASSSSAYASSTWTSSTSSSSQASGSSGSGGLSSVPTAITYTPYNDDSSCKSSDQVSSDLQVIHSKGISKIRVYGTDCNSLDTILSAASSLGIKVNQGLWIDDQGVDSIDDAVESLIQYGQSNGWDVFDFITVGNEAINSGYCSVSDLISKIKSVKSQLQNAGFSGSVITSEPPVSFENNPELCTESGIDFVGVNPHSYFDSGISADQAGQFVKGQVQLAQNACPNMKIIVTETGYPSEGDQNGDNIPSPSNQIIAVNSILQEMDNDVTILSFFNDKWKNPGPYGIEQWFGVEDILS